MFFLLLLFSSRQRRMERARVFVWWFLPADCKQCDISCVKRGHLITVHTSPIQQICHVHAIVRIVQ